MMFCPNCGVRLPENASFCPNCGAAFAPAPGAPAFAGNGAVREGVPAPGFSDRVNHPEVLAAVKKNRKAAGVFSMILVPLPLVGFAIYAAVSGEMDLAQGLLYGGILSGIFLIFFLIGAIKNRASNTYDAVVEKKVQRETYRHSNSDHRERVTEYVTVVRTADGRKKKIVEQEGSQIWAWQYLNEGDRFRYHPQFSFPYELFDKSRAPYIACVACGSQNPVTADRCGRCKTPLLK